MSPVALTLLPLLLLGLAAPGAPAGEEEIRPFAFLALGDLHFDRPEHHRMDWLAQEHPGDVRQVHEYTAITQAVWPRLCADLRGLIADSRPPVAFLAQLGDLLEGLCGSPDLARRQAHEALNAVGQELPGVPFLMTKGNHDITGPGAAEVYKQVVLPFLSEQAKQPVTQTSFAWRHGDSLFLFYDAYAPDSLEWLERALAARPARHVFVLVHMPVVPFGARSLWHLYARPEEQARRQRLLALLGRHRAIVLCGHLHRYGVVVRETEGGRFVQLALSSVIPSPDARPAQERRGVEQYGPGLVSLEPDFEPRTEPERRAALRAEAPFIRYYEYADAPGYALLTVEGARVQAHLYTGTGRRLWKTLDLTALLSGR